MELTPEYYDKGEYIETDTGNKVSRKSVIHGSQNIILGGKTIIQTGTVVRGDLRRSGTAHAVVIAIGKYALLASRSVVRPPSKVYKSIFSYYPIKIGDFVHIGEGSIVEAAQIGSYVQIGKNCVIGRFAIIKDCTKILDNTVIAPNCIVPSFSVYGGSPGALIEELPECWSQVMEKNAKIYYSMFTPK
ncbi:hypothetical protein HK100_005317 [Physocladia obscura]|uniref:Dynactin subunit 5 n=1 Tax=Physocladia obscura TaxID=109957 RepID=A0AAD5XID5_9FUNG|nr:hypothetical protein HK100_005317 [Physocladia obscura]